jgi:hypothetical protein
MSRRAANQVPAGADAPPHYDPQGANPFPNYTYVCAILKGSSAQVIMWFFMTGLVLFTTMVFLKDWNIAGSDLSHLNRNLQIALLLLLSFFVLCLSHFFRNHHEKQMADQYPIPGDTAVTSDSSLLLVAVLCAVPIGLWLYIDTFKNLQAEHVFTMVLLNVLLVVMIPNTANVVRNAAYATLYATKPASAAAQRRVLGVLEGSWTMKMHKYVSIVTLMVMEYLYLHVYTTVQAEDKFGWQLSLTLGTICASYVVRTTFENPLKGSAEKITIHMQVATFLSVLCPFLFICRHAYIQWSMDGTQLVLISILNVAITLAVSVATRNELVVDTVRLARPHEA